MGFARVSRAAINCGMPGERVFKGLDDLPDDPGCFTILVVRRED